jgi:PRTRC genetic system protein A
MKLVDAILAEEAELPPQGAMGYEYVTAANGYFVRAEDSRMAALVEDIPGPRLKPGLAMLAPFARLKVPLVPEQTLRAMLKSARARLPREAMYQLYYDPLARNAFGGWACVMPPQTANPMAVTFADTCEAVVDLHSHNTMAAFFSGTDNADEQGLRFYAVIGRIDTSRPQIAVRAGVYGYHLRVPAETVFSGLGPFEDTYGRCGSCGKPADDGELCDECWAKEEIEGKAENETAEAEAG